MVGMRLLVASGAAGVRHHGVVEVERLSIASAGPMLVTAVIDASVLTLAASKSLDYVRAWEQGLGWHLGIAIELPSGRPCVLQQNEDRPGLGVDLLAEPEDD